MKKKLAILLAAVMMVSLAACGSKDAGASTGEAASTGTTEVAADGTVTTSYGVATTVDESLELPHYEVLVSYGQFTDKLGSQFKSSIEYICNELNCTPTFVEANTMGDEAVTTLQAALVNHYDFAIGVGTSEGILKVFEDAGVPYVVSGTVLSGDEQKAMVKNYSTFLGCVGVDDYGAMEEGARTLASLGCKNVIWCGLPLGMAGQHDQRLLGFEETAEAEGMTLLTEALDYTAWADAIANAAATYPELDGIGATALNEATYNTIVSEGLENQVKVCGIDISEGTGAAFEAGYLAYIAGGNYVTEQIAFAVAYNYVLDGTRVIEDPSETLLWNNIDIHNIDEYNDYMKYLDGGVPGYTALEILEMTHWYNDSVTPATFAEMGKAYTLEDVMARHADLF